MFGFVHKPLNAVDPCTVPYRTSDVALPNSIEVGTGRRHMVLNALGVALVIATMWSALQFEGRPLE